MRGARSPRVLIAHSQAEWYGSDRALHVLAAHLLDLGIDITVALPGEGPLAERLRARGVPIVIVDPAALRLRTLHGLAALRLLVGLPLAVVRWARLARRYDVVHANTSILAAPIVGGFLAGRPTILHVRESYAGAERMWNLYGRALRPFTSKVLATSADIASEVAAAGLGDRVLVVHDGLEFAPYEPGAGLGPVVAVGRINSWKGHDVLIEAVAKLRARGLDVPVAIAGDTIAGQEHLRVALAALADSLGVGDLVTFLGFVDDVPRLLANARLFVQPSVRPEPFGLALVEAMAHGVACIATDAGGPREIINAPTTGLLVPQGDTEALAQAIARLWGDPEARRAMGAAAAQDVRARFGAERSAREVAEVYRDLLESAPRPHGR